MSTEEGTKGLSSSYSEIEELQNNCLREWNGLSKVFISLSIAFLVLTLSLIGPRLSQQHALHWIVAMWFSLVTIAIIGFLQIYMFSKRFRPKAEHLHACMIADVIVQTKGSEKKLNEFLLKSDEADGQFKRSYKWCVGIVLAQGIIQVLSFIFFGLFVRMNNWIKSVP
jgi:hypothetical protein